MEQNSVSNIALIYGLAGTIFGVVLNKAFDLFSLTRQHRLNLKREFFIKKLATYEKAINYLFTVQNTVQLLTTNFKDILDETKYFDNDTIAKILTLLQKNLSDVSSNSQEAALALNLYIDIDNDIIDSLQFDRFYSIMGEVGLIAQNLQTLRLEYPSVEYGKGNAELDKRIDEQLRRFKGKTDEMDLIAKRLEEKYLKVVAELRSSVKQYD